MKRSLIAAPLLSIIMLFSRILPVQAAEEEINPLIGTWSLDMPSSVINQSPEMQQFHESMPPEFFAQFKLYFTPETVFFAGMPDPHAVNYEINTPEITVRFSEGPLAGTLVLQAYLLEENMIRVIYPDAPPEESVIFRRTE